MINLPFGDGFYQPFMVISLSLHRHVDIGIVYYWVYHIVSLYFLPQGDIKQYN